MTDEVQPQDTDSGLVESTWVRHSKRHGELTETKVGPGSLEECSFLATRTAPTIAPPPARPWAGPPPAPECRHPAGPGGRAVVARPLPAPASLVPLEGERPPAGPVGVPASCRPPATATATVTPSAAAAETAGDAELVGRPARLPVGPPATARTSPGHHRRRW
jgi:hypothetical protein